MQFKRGFASDNNSGVHPKILKALSECNVGHAIGYGDDPVTQETENIFKSIFGDQSETFFVMNGTGANIVSLQTVTQSFHSIICTNTAHIDVDECGAPEKFTGAKLIAVDTPDGKLTPELVKPHLHGFGFEHHSQPKVISITQVSEMGTLYSLDEISALADLAHDNNMYLHVDGARISNAAVALNCSFKEMITDTGVDLLSFGGTKNGLMFGEAIVFLKPNLSGAVRYYRKQASQLYSKMRYVSAQFKTYLKDDIWLANAKHANKMAQLLVKEVQGIPNVVITQEVKANGVFAIIPQEVIEPLRAQFFYYDWDTNKCEVRWMTSFDTTEQDVLAFAEVLRSEMSKLN